MSDTFSQDTLRFFAWVKANYDVSPKFQVEDLRSDSQGRGLVATDDIAQDEVLFELSRDLVINVESSSLGAISQDSKEFLISLNQWEALVLCLSYELFLGEKSKWKDYLKLLPSETSDFHTLMFWTPKQVETLRPSLVVDRIGKDSAEKMYHRMVPDYCNRLGVPELASYLTLSKFHSVASLIMSYSFDVEHAEVAEEAEDEEVEEVESTCGQGCGDNCTCDDAEESNDDEEPDESDSEPDIDCVQYDDYLKSMVPLADTLNANTSLVNATLHYDGIKLAMKATKDIKKGEQIYNTYGDIPNSEILRKYGYVELPSAKTEFAEVPLKLIKQVYHEKFSSAFKIKSIDHIVDCVFDLIANSSFLQETLEDNEGGIVIERYEIYSHAESLPEFILLLLILSTLLESWKSDPKWFRKMSHSVDRPQGDFSIFVNRVINKCYQLLEERSIITDSLCQDFKAIIAKRLSEYSQEQIDYELPSSFSLNLTRQDLARIVTKNEVQCLQSSLHFPKGQSEYNVIDDAKFLKNVLKHKSDEPKHKKRRL